MIRVEEHGETLGPFGENEQLGEQKQQSGRAEADDGRDEQHLEDLGGLLPVHA